MITTMVTIYACLFLVCGLSAAVGFILGYHKGQASMKIELKVKD